MKRPCSFKQGINTEEILFMIAGVILTGDKLCCDRDFRGK